MILSGGQVSTKVSVLVLATEVVALGKDPSSLQNLLWSCGLGQLHVFPKHAEEITEVSSIAQLHAEKRGLVREVNASFLFGFPKCSLEVCLQLFAASLGEGPFASKALNKKQFSLFVNADDANDVFCVFAECGHVDLMR